MTDHTGYQPGRPGPGWYPDPSGDYEQRWFDGTLWTADVVTGAFRGSDPVPAHGAPLPEQEFVVWQSGADTLTTHRLVLGSTAPARPPETFELWMVQAVQARRSGPVGDVEITIGYAGYGGRATWVLRNAPEPAYVAALVHRQANRVRRSLANGRG